MRAPARADIEDGRSVQDRLERSTYIYKIVAGGFVGSQLSFHIKLLFILYNMLDYGGWGGIRTHGTLAGTPVFKTGALNHSATHPSS
jgi:hypothetical protein